MKLKKTKYMIILVLSVVLIWYLLIKQHDYIVTFKAETSPGTLYKGLEEWNEISQKLDSFKYVLNKKKPFESFEETIEFNKLKLQLDWEIKAIDDTISKVKVGFTEKGHSIYNRLTAPFLKTPFREKSINLIQEYRKWMDYQLKNKFKVKIYGIDTIPELSYAYISLKNIKMDNKAIEMMNNNSFFLSFLNKHNLKKGEYPFIMVDNWDLNNNQIDFKFCFPINERDSLPLNEDIKYGKIKKSKLALKAIYNGNYVTSDRGWFGLYEYAKRHDISINNQPIEFFYTNPFYGGDELKWVTEIYMPIK